MADSQGRYEYIPFQILYSPGEKPVYVSSWWVRAVTEKASEVRALAVSNRPFAELICGQFNIHHEHAFLQK